MSLIIHNKYKYFDSTVQGAEDKRLKFHFCRLPFAVNVMLNLSNVIQYSYVVRFNERTTIKILFGAKWSVRNSVIAKVCYC